MKITAARRAFAAVDVDDMERRLLMRLFADTAALLVAEDGGADDEPGTQGGGAHDEEAARLERLVGLASGERPEDPAVLRLLPDAAPDDPERAAEFRRLTERDLREGKLANLRIALHGLAGTGRIELTEEEARAWLTALTDVRLVIATRLELVSDDDLERLYDRGDDLDDNTAAMVSVYDFLTWAQERLSEIMLDALDARPSGGGPA
ncbi:DUF2017 family protein [Brevibacterium sp. 5221]|uniref:DUF2017 family protein n=1 Tax=Brevibacterium rongguiense TaxID=2695267 RepID=A0A6N9HA21_9MICO|nr:MULTISPECIES: DUF2017 domain-containing protein [Brevibacterium]MYM20621.1 DUF2017 family protein [Brevibacterium rongguiense]WAL40256.1 DUF2017 domain-containing protein [Brevibacterium sp. BRM-1]